jgi:hypothetical protein
MRAPVPSLGAATSSATLALLVLLLGGCGDPVPFHEEFGGPWRSDPNSDIIRALAKASVAGCGEFHYKRSTQYDGYYFVYCTRDGERWTTYFVYGYSEEVLGPFRPDPDIGKPY